jgi:hypothetical protein
MDHLVVLTISSGPLGRQVLSADFAIEGLVLWLSPAPVDAFSRDSRVP